MAFVAVVFLRPRRAIVALPKLKEQEMKKRFIALIALFAVFITCFAGCGSRKAVELTYVDLKNNDTGFTTTEADTAVAVGMNKSDDTLFAVNDYLSTLTDEDKKSLMQSMVNLNVDEKASFKRQNSAVSSSAKTFKVGMECDYAPYNWTQNTNANGGYPISNQPGKYANGYDVQIAFLIAENLGMKLEIHSYLWEGLVPAVQSGALDAIVAGMSPTEERKKEIAFSTPYYNSNLVIVTRKDSKIFGKTTLKDADISGVKIAGQPGTFHLDALKTQTSKVTVIDSLATFSDMLMALNAGTIDGYVAEEPTAMNVCGQKNDSNEGFFKSVGNILKTYWRDFLKGIGFTLLISLVSTLAGLVIGLLIGVVRTIPKSKKKWLLWLQRVIDFLLSAYIEIFRGTPMMVQAMVIYWGYAFATGGRTLNLMVSAIFIVSINTGAYIAEIVRGGITGIDKGQFEGARAIGMGHVKTMRYIVLPQVMKSILPAVSNEFVINIKDTSVLNVIGVTELYFFTNVIVKQTYKNFPVYFICCVIYFVLTFVITRIIKLIEKRISGKVNYSLAGSRVINEEK